MNSTTVCAWTALALALALVWASESRAGCNPENPDLPDVYGHWTQIFQEDAAGSESGTPLGLGVTHDLFLYRNGLYEYKTNGAISYGGTWCLLYCTEADNHCYEQIGLHLDAWDNFWYVVDPSRLAYFPVVPTDRVLQTRQRGALDIRVTWELVSSVGAQAERWSTLKSRYE